MNFSYSLHNIEREIDDLNISIALASEFMFVPDFSLCYESIRVNPNLAQQSRSQENNSLAPEIEERDAKLEKLGPCYH